MGTKKLGLGLLLLLQILLIFLSADGNLLQNEATTALHHRESKLPMNTKMLKGEIVAVDRRGGGGGGRGGGGGGRGGGGSRGGGRSRGTRIIPFYGAGTMNHRHHSNQGTLHFSSPNCLLVASMAAVLVQFFW